MTKIRALPTGSEIELTVNVTVDSNTDAKPGWGVGSIGTWDSKKSLSINIPSDAQNGDLTFKVRFKIANVLIIVGDDSIKINLYNGATVTKAELFKPGN